MRIFFLLFLVLSGYQQMRAQPLGDSSYYQSGTAINRKTTQPKNKETVASRSIVGEKIQYYPNGKIKIIEHYKNNLLHGDWFLYSENGELLTQKLFNKGQLDQRVISYYTNGNIREYYPYQIFNINGKDTGLIHGKKLIFTLSGKLKSEQNHVKGLSYGEFCIFYENGNLEREIFDLGNNKRVSLKEYSPDGVLLTERHICFKSGDSSQSIYHTCAKYYFNGIPSYQFINPNCSDMGWARSFYPNGKKMIETFVFKRKSEDDDLVSYRCGTAWQAFYYPNGSLWYEVFKVNDMAHGQYIEWFPDGKLKRFINPRGLDIQWLQDGSLMTSIVYNVFNNTAKDTVLDKTYLTKLYIDLSSGKQSQLLITGTDGKIQSYYAHGVKRFETYIKDSLFTKYFLAYTYAGDTLAYLEFNEQALDGRFLIKNTDNTTHKIGNYRQGKEVGDWKLYSLNGVPRTFYGYDKNSSERKPYSYEYTFYENGQLKTKSGFVNGKLNGWHMSFHTNGQLKDSIYYESDTLNGKWVTYSDDGKLQTLAYYKSGEKEGVCTQWYNKINNFRCMKVELYKKNQRDGVVSYFHPNGKLQLTAFYREGKEDSIWVYYDTLGREEKRVLFKMGHKVKQPERLGKCACEDPEDNTITFAGKIDHLIEDHTDIKLWEFPFHEHIEPLLSKTFFKDIYTNSSSFGIHYTFTAVVLEPAKIAIPNSKGMKLILNPCWHQGRASNIHVNINFQYKKPDKTFVELSAPQMAFELPAFIFINAINKEKPVLANFSMKAIIANSEGIQFYKSASKCTDEAYLLSKEYKLILKSFDLHDINPTFENFYSLGYINNYLPKSYEVNFKNHPPIIKDGNGQLFIKLNDKTIQSNIQSMHIGDNWAMGQIQIQNVTVREAKLVVQTNEGEVVFTQKSLYEQMKLHGFTYLDGRYIPETGTLVIDFYIHKK